MASVKWTVAHSVWITEIDDQHKEIFEALAQFKDLLSGSAAPAEQSKAAERLTDSIEGHFAHEERLMRAAQYDGLRWHKGQHEAARQRARQLLGQMEQG